MTIHAYLPQDRLRAIANGISLPDRTSGSALFADISGFTALTESLREKFGARQGVEELTKQLDLVYSLLIAEIEKNGGSVIGFAGDSMLCWFDKSGDGDRGSGNRALCCAYAMQESIREFPALALKICIASGDARRFVVGDEAIQRIDTLAGATVARTAIGEHLSTKGDVLVDSVTASLLGDSLSIQEWRVGEGGERFAVVEQPSGISEKPSVQPLMIGVLISDNSIFRPFIHPAVYERETSGQGSFLTEFRPCVALFVRFTGIDYDSDSAEAELESFVCQTQTIVSRYGGTFLQLTIGDKGSYVYISFGALTTYEDDAKRAVKTALELMNASSLQLQMGITQGVMRVGAYGGETRKVFGVLGDDVNIAARLMTTAKENEILLSSHVYKSVNEHFTFEVRPAVMVKGKSEPIPLYQLIGESRRRAVRLQEPNYSLPMVGRQAELKHIEEKLDLAKEGNSQVIGIVAEAGLGKSRLVAEVIRSARRKGFIGFGGACQSDGLKSPYLAWKMIWTAFFGIDPDATLKKQVRMLEEELEEHAPDRREALPLLGPILNLDIPDNDFTRNLEPEQRKNVLTTLLQNCLSAATRSEPILIVVEDLHWVDALSHDLLEALAKALVDCPVCFVLAYRPPQLKRLQGPQIETLPYFTRIKLEELNPAEGEQAIRAKLAQLYPSRSGAVSAGLVEALMARAQGNPFYLEELLNYVRDLGLDPEDIQNIELPDSLHTLILSRIDKLSEGEKTTLRAASIVGRLFRAQWLMGYYPELGSSPQVKAALEALEALDITPLASPEPELTYLFKHIVTHEVTYESLPFAIRTQLHEHLAAYLESIDAPVEVIAQHYGRSNNQGKQREYWLKAGDAAREAFDNESALDYYERLHPLISEAREQGSLYLKRAEVHYGRGRLAEARKHLTLGLNLIGHPLPGTALQTQAGLFVESVKQFWHRIWFPITPIVPDETKTGMNKDDMELLRAFELVVLIDTLANQIGLTDYYLGMKILNMAESARCKSPILARAYASLGLGMGHMPSPMHALAQDYFRRAHATLTGLDHLYTQAYVLWQEGQVAVKNGKWEDAEKAYQQAVEISDRLGDRRNWATALCVLGWIAHYQGQFELCIKRFAEVYQNGQASNHVEHQVWGLNGQAVSLLRLGKITQAADMMEKVLKLFDLIADSGLAEQNTQGILTVTYLHEGKLEKARDAADKTARLLKQAFIPIAPSFDSYSNVAYIYLALWERSGTPREKSEMKLFARQACRALHQFAWIHPIAKSRALLWQGLYDWLNGKPRSAQEKWKKSLATAQKMSMPHDEALAYREIGRHTIGAERDLNLDRANEIFKRLGVALAAV
jgi:adenylate cyclase